MRNKQNMYDRTGSSQDFSNNEGYHNYQDYTDHSFRNTPRYAAPQGPRNEFRNDRPNYLSDNRAGGQTRQEWNRPSLQNADRYESSDASMIGGDPARRSSSQYSQGSTSYGQGSQQYGSGSYQSERFDASNNGNYGYGSYTSAPSEYSSSNTSGHFSWQAPEKKLGLHAGKGPKGYRRSDERIREDVNEALSAHSEIDASEIEVDVKEGIVTLSGTVDSRQIKRLTEDTVEGISGVTDVKNDLRVMTSIENVSRSSLDGDTALSRTGSKSNLAGRQQTSSQSTSSKSVQ